MFVEGQVEVKLHAKIWKFDDLYEQIHTRRNNKHIRLK